LACDFFNYMELCEGEVTVLENWFVLTISYVKMCDHIHVGE